MLLNVYIQRNKHLNKDITYNTKQNKKKLQYGFHLEHILIGTGMGIRTRALAINQELLLCHLSYRNSCYYSYFKCNNLTLSFYILSFWFRLLDLAQLILSAPWQIWKCLASIKKHVHKNISIRTLPFYFLHRETLITIFNFNFNSLFRSFHLYISQNYRKDHDNTSCFIQHGPLSASVMAPHYHILNQFIQSYHII